MGNLVDYLTTARDKFTDTMDGIDRFATGLNNRAKRLKQAMFPEEPKPASSPPMETTPQNWERGGYNERGYPKAMERETQRAKRSRR